MTLAEGQKVKNIEFEVYDYTVQYIQTKPLHRTQELIQTEKKKSIFRIQLIPNYELESLFLSYGENIRVIKPKSLANKLKARVGKSVKNYQ